MLFEAAGRPIRQPDDVYDALGTVDGSGSLSLRLVRGNDELDVNVNFAAESPTDTGGGPVH
jgi:hypothetical protein